MARPVKNAAAGRETALANTQSKAQRREQFIWAQLKWAARHGAKTLKELTQSLNDEEEGNIFSPEEWLEWHLEIAGRATSIGTSDPYNYAGKIRPARGGDWNTGQVHRILVARGYTAKTFYERCHAVNPYRQPFRRYTPEEIDEMDAKCREIDRLDIPQIEKKRRIDTVYKMMVDYYPGGDWDW